MGVNQGGPDPKKSAGYEEKQNEAEKDGMYLTVGQIAKVFGISNEMIRFYIRKGIIKPEKNQENNYWQYSSEDLLVLSDILFYRTMDFSLKDIKEILNGLPYDSVGRIISKRRKELEEEIRKKQLVVEELSLWENMYCEELELLNSFEIRKMPANLRKLEYFQEDSHIAEYLTDNDPFDKETLSYMSLSIFCDLSCDPPEVKRYLAFSRTRETEHLHRRNYVVEEEPADCLCLQVHYNADAVKMIAAVKQCAAAAGLRLSGKIYFFENTNYYENGERKGLFRAYAVIER